jgi:hypothetical protein
LRGLPGLIVARHWRAATQVCSGSDSRWKLLLDGPFVVSMRLRLVNLYCHSNSLRTVWPVLEGQTTGKDFYLLLLILVKINTWVFDLLILFNFLSDLDINKSLLLKDTVNFFWLFHHWVKATWHCSCLGYQITVLLRYISQGTSPWVQIVAKWVFCKWYPPFFLVIKLFSFWVESSNGESVLIDEANFVSQIPAFVHNGESLPLACFDINLFHVGRKPATKTTTENNYFVRLRTKTCTVR